MLADGSNKPFFQNQSQTRLNKLWDFLFFGLRQEDPRCAEYQQWNQRMMPSKCFKFLCLVLVGASAHLCAQDTGGHSSAHRSISRHFTPQHITARVIPSPPNISCPILSHHDFYKSLSLFAEAGPSSWIRWSFSPKVSPVVPNVFFSHFWNAYLHLRIFRRKVETRSPMGGMRRLGPRQSQLIPTLESCAPGIVSQEAFWYILIHF